MVPSNRPALLAALLATALLAACGEGEGEEDEGPNMAPGSACMNCHGFTAAGTVFGGGAAAASAGVSGATVTISDSAGHTVTRTTNTAGNFFTSSTLTPPLTVTIVRGGNTVTRSGKVSGNCGTCHFPGNAVGAPGRVHVGACADCH